MVVLAEMATEEHQLDRILDIECKDERFGQLMKEEEFKEKFIV